MPTDSRKQAATRAAADTSAKATAADASPKAPATTARGEHILLEGEDAPQFEGPDAHAVLRQFALHNRMRGSRTAFRLFDGGYLGVCAHRRGASDTEYVLYLRYLDPKPLLSRSVPRKALGIAIGLIAVEFVLGVLAYSAVRPGLIALLALGTSLAMGIALLLFVRGARERVAFQTKHGRTVVMTLTANFGCFAASRMVVRELVHAIAEARKHKGREKQRLLRDEMREHYRLCEVGVLTKDACAAATQRILAEFD